MISPGHDRQRNTDAYQPVPGEGGEAPAVADHVGEESRDEEEELHAKRMRGEEEPEEAGAAAGVYDRAAEWRGHKTPCSVENNAQQQGESAGGVEGVETFRMGLGWIFHCWSRTVFRLQSTVALFRGKTAQRRGRIILETARERRGSEQPAWSDGVVTALGIHQEALKSEARHLSAMLSKANKPH